MGRRTFLKSIMLVAVVPTITAQPEEHIIRVIGTCNSRVLSVVKVED